MYSSYSISKRLVMVLIFAVVVTQLLFIHNVSSLNMTNSYLHHKCLAGQGKYHRGSEYEKNLNQLIRNSTLNGNFRNGFDLVTHGDQSENFVTFMYQCRGDSYGPKCQSCYTTAISELRRRCPRNKGSIIWYDQCLIKISSIVSNGKVDYDNNICMSNAKNVSDEAAFYTKFIGFLSKLYMEASGDSKMLYATGEDMFEKKKMYGMVQCTKDLSSKTCEVCLEWIMAKESECCKGKQGGRVFSTSCSYRFEFYPFYQL